MWQDVIGHKISCRLNLLTTLHCHFNYPLTSLTPVFYLAHFSKVYYISYFSRLIKVYHISFYTWSNTFLQCYMCWILWSLQRLKEIQCWDAYFNLGLERIFCFNIFNIVNIFNKCIFCRLCICICISVLNLKCICQVYMTIFGVYSVFVMYFWPAGEVY